MSFFETASLVLISDFAAASASAVSGSGANTGKAYSIKPTDGSGDFTFERGSDITATRVNKDGYIEKGRGNLTPYSNDFSNTSTWIQSASTRTSGQAGYDGSNDAWEIVRAATGTIVLTNSEATSGVITFSLYVKVNADKGIGLVFNGNTSNLAAFNISDTSQTSPVSTSGDVIDASITYIGNNWYRIAASFNGTNSGVQIRSLSADGSSFQSGGTYIIQDAQLEQGLVATDYIETTTAPLRAGLLEDEPRFDYHNSASASPNTCPSLLMEPSRTNLITNSEYFEALSTVGPPTLTLEDINSPEGVSNAYSIVKRSATDNSDRVQQSLGVLGTNHVFSIFLKLKSTTDTFNVRLKNNQGETVEAIVSTDGTMVAGGPQTDAANYDIENYGNGWYRLWMETTTSATLTNFYQILPNVTNTSIGECYFYGAQVEEGSYPTSYIPTYGTAATRSNEDYSNTSLSNIGSTDRCTFYCEIDLPQGREGSQRFFRLDSSTSSFAWKGNNYEFPVISIIGTGNIMTSGAFTVPTGVHKLIVRWENGVGSIFLDGVKKSEQTTSSTTEVFDEFRSEGTGYRHLQKSALVFPEALSDTDCEILTGATTYSSFAAMASALNYTVYE